MLSALAVVLGLMAGLAAVARWWLGRRSLSATEVPLIQVLGTCHLGPRKSIVLVAVGGDWFVVGATAHDLVPLGRISDSERARIPVGRGAAVLEGGGTGAAQPTEPGPW